MHTRAQFLKFLGQQASQLAVEHLPRSPAAAAATPVRCLQLLRTAKAALGEILSAFEFLDRQALQLTMEHLPEAADPLPGKQAPIYIILETSGSNEEHDHAKLQVG